jgi:hypothetical protein
MHAPTMDDVTAAQHSRVYVAVQHDKLNNAAAPS